MHLVKSCEDLSKTQVMVNFGKKCLQVQKAENFRLRQEFGNPRQSLLRVLAWEVSGGEYGQDSRVSTQNLCCLGIPGPAVFSSIPDNLIIQIRNKNRG